MKTFPKYTGTETVSIYNAFAEMGLETSQEYRKRVAIANGIENYTGTAAQNLDMLEMLRAGVLIDPDGTSILNIPTGDSSTTPNGTNTTGTKTNWLKWGIIGGVVILAGVLTYKLTRKNKTVKQSDSKKKN